MVFKFIHNKTSIQPMKNNQPVERYQPWKPCGGDCELYIHTSRANENGYWPHWNYDVMAWFCQDCFEKQGGNGPKNKNL